VAIVLDSCVNLISDNGYAYIVIYRNDDDSNAVLVLRIVRGRRWITNQMLGSG